MAEDNAANCLLAVRLLEEAGHRVTALHALERVTFDLALMDVQMLSWTAVKPPRFVCRSSRRDSTMPIVAMTAHAIKGDHERCLAAGMDGYVTKPFQVHNLFSVIAAATAGISKHTEEPISNRFSRLSRYSPCTSDLVMLAVLDWRGVRVVVEPGERLGIGRPIRDTSRPERLLGQRQERGLVFPQQIALAGRLPASPLSQIGQAVVSQLLVQRLQRIDLRHWHQQVTPALRRIGHTPGGASRTLMRQN